MAVRRRDPDEAVQRLVEVIAERTGIASGDRVCDIGCGYGATARLLARAYGAQVVGVTVSNTQYAYACSQQAQDGNPQYLLRDWLANDFPSGTFDVALSIESSEHMADKAKFFQEAYRVLRPGGHIGIYAWLAKDKPRRWEVDFILEPVCS